MGTPVACIYATLFFAFHERTTLLPKYNKNLLYYGRQIDDILLVWQDNDPSLPFSTFFHDLNNLCNLKWTTSKLQTTVNFLDLTISIDPNTHTIVTTSYHKPKHLFNYLPPHSAHAPGVLKSLIYGLFQTYYHQNTKHHDFLTNISKLHQRLLKRGHDHSIIKKLLIDCANHITSKLHHPISHHILHPPKSHPSKPSDHQLFFHIKYHPRDISRQRIHNMFETICAAPDDNGDSLTHGYHNKHGCKVKFPKLTIAYSRPKNLRDHLCPTKLTTTDPSTGTTIPDPSVSQIYKSSYLS